METKVCRHCRKEFPATLEFFYKAGNKRVGLRAICKKCNHLETNKGQHKEEVRKVKMRLYLMKRTYEVEPEFIMELMDKQKGCCAIVATIIVIGFKIWR